MYQQQPMMGYTYGQMPYVTYNQPTLPQFTNPLGKQKIEELKKNGNGAIKLQITEEDMNKALCTHRDGSKLELYSTHNPNKPGEVRCRICGAEFVPVENVTQEDINACCEDFHNLMHTCKVLNLDIAPKLCHDIFQVLPITDRIPEIYKIAADRFNQYMDPYNTARNVNPYMGGMQLLNTLVGSPMGMGQPMMNPMMGQPMMQPQQMMNPMMSQPMMGQQMGMQQPMMGQPMPMMNQQMGPAQPMMNPMQMQMTANAPGMQTNGFGVTAAPTNINVEPTAPQTPPVQQQQPVVTKQLQA